jgi:3-oxoacyl-[acyl-carrier protein] reductase
MAKALAGKVAIVTGAGGGIGATCAQSLAREGAAVVVHYNSRATEAEAVVAGIIADGGQAITVQGDLLMPETAAQVVAASVGAFGKVDILVNNSGVMVRAALAEITPDILLSQFQINAFAPLYMIQAALPHFPAEGGAVINITTNLTHAAMRGVVAYSSAKAALENMTVGFFKELAPRRITVNAVAPGATRTAMTAAHMTPESERMLSERTPLGRMGETDDIAEVVVFLASPAGRWITGQSILVDGGFTMGAFG